jgi:hypothetical protein
MEAFDKLIHLERPRNCSKKSPSLLKRELLLSPCGPINYLAEFADEASGQRRFGESDQIRMA